MIKNYLFNPYNPPSGSIILCSYFIYMKTAWATMCSVLQLVSSVPKIQTPVWLSPKLFLIILQGQVEGQVTIKERKMRKV